MLRVESSDACEVLEAFFQNHMVSWFKVKSYVVGSLVAGEVLEGFSKIIWSLGLR